MNLTKKELARNLVMIVIGSAVFSLGFDEGESVIDVCFPGDYEGSVVFAYENGKVAQVELSAYATKSNRRKLTGAYCDKSPLRRSSCLKRTPSLSSIPPRAGLWSSPPPSLCPKPPARPRAWRS